MKITKKIGLIVMCSYLLISCQSNSKENIYFLKSDNLKEIHISNSDNSLIILFYENGKLKNISRKNEKGQLDKEQLWFNPYGNLDRKYMISNNQINGKAYYFYPESGSLKSERYFRKGKQVFYGTDFWEDSIGNIKSTLHFNEEGEIYYKKNFDNHGNFINEEGRR